jgi:hypothetical protein
MTKKKKKSSQMLANASPAALRGDFPHDAFDAALRKYTHPAAVADLDQLTPSGPAWKKYLEAFGQSCLDLSLFFNQQIIMGRVNELPLLNNNTNNKLLDMKCPLLGAIALWKGQQCLDGMKDVYDTLIQSLTTYGRPLPQKSNLLWEHQARVVQLYGNLEKNKSGGCVMRTTSNSIRKQVSMHTSNIDWENLVQINIKDLVLYDSNEGTYIEGKLLVEPFTPRVATTTILEDSNGDVILVALYNFLPDGLYGRESIPLASSKLPMGATVRIAGPFLKIFQDGSRGIRIDNPNDVSIVSSGTSAASRSEDVDKLLLSAKNSGNALVLKKMYNAASEAYIAGIRQADMVPTLLSNRSQAYAMMNDWERSLADAAASLTMCPTNSKSWARYNNALEILLEQNNNDRRSVMTSLFCLESEKQAIESETNGKNASALKDAGNTAFKNKQFNKAAEFYTSALVMHGETSRALLSNWALCCIRNSANLDALSASFASLRIRHEAKAVNRLANSLFSLGEIELCKTVLTSEVFAHIVKGNDVLNEQNELFNSVHFAFEHFIRCERRELFDGCHALPVIIPHKHLPTWIGPIESFHAGANKGRGIRAIVDIKEGQLLLIEPPLAMSETDGKKEILFTIDSSLKDHSQVYLRQAIILRSQRECVLSRIVDCLSDGVNQRGVSVLKDLIPNLASCKLLLPTHYDFMKEEAKLELTADRVDAIVGVNSFGDQKSRDSLAKNNMGHVHTRLVPATSLFNHSKHPSCFWSWNGGCSIVFAVKDVKAGEELTICYHPDEKAIRRHWHIHE